MMLAFTVIAKVPPVSALSKVPDPVMVAEEPIAIEVGSKSLTFPWVEASPQSCHVTFRVPPVLESADARVRNATAKDFIKPMGKCYHRT
jgi:hypothetical protein